MESSKEKIEAQLCAYIDGELSPAERAEIERHLATNSQHKALIAELRRQSGLLQDLPRVKAPPELNEALCGQLERSALLDPAEADSPDAILSINRWPQITAIAAVLMLAIGLGVVVYYVLPPSQPRGQVAIGTTNPATDFESAKSGQVGAASQGQVFRDSGRADLLKSGRDARLTVRAKGAPDAGAGIDPALIRSNNNGLITAREVEMLRKRTSGDKVYDADNPSLYLVVAAENPAQAATQVTTYFRNNNIQYMSYDESAVRGGGGAGGSSGLGAPDQARGGATGLSAAAGKTLSDEAAAVPADKIALREQAAPLDAKDRNKEALPRDSDVRSRGAGGGGRANEPQGESILEKAKQYAPPAPLATAPAKPEDPAQTPNGRGFDKPAQEEPAPLNRAYGGGRRPAGAETSPEIIGRNVDALSESAARKSPSETEVREKPDLQITAAITAEKGGTSLNGIYRARMNRRQADELSALLSQRQGQHAALSYGMAGTAANSSSGAISPAESGYKAGIDSYAFSKAKDGAAAAQPKESAVNDAKQGETRGRPAFHEEKLASPGAPALQQQVGSAPATRPEADAVVAQKPAGATAAKEDAMASSQGQRRVLSTEPSQRPEVWNLQRQSGQLIGGQKSEALSPQPEPQDEPVDVLIVVKQEGPADSTTFELGIQPTTRPAAGRVDAEKKK